MALLIILAAVVFGRIIGYDFQVNWDDNWFILYNDSIRGFSLEHLKTAFSSYIVGSYVPLLTLSFMLDHALWGYNPGGFHATSILIHTVNALLIYRLFYRLYADRLLCLVGSALFLIHPVQVESVAWLSDRKTLLAMMFFLLGWEGYCRYRSATAGKARWWAYAASLAFFALALLSKSIAVIMPGVLLLFDFCFYHGERRVRLLDKIPYVAVAGGIAAVTMIGFSTPEGGSVPYHGGTFLATFFSMLPVFCRYLGMLVWPANLSAVYTPTIHHSLDGTVAAAALLLGVLLIVSVLLYRRERRLGFWVLFSVVAIFPVSQLIPILTMMADRYLYFPMVGVSALAGSGAVWLRDRIGASLHKALYGLLLLPFVALSIASFQRAAVWHDSLTLWSDAVAKEPNSDKAWEVLAGVYSAAGNTIAARRCYERGFRLNPLNTEILQGLGDLYTEADELDNGYDLLNKLLTIKPTYVTGWASLGNNYMKRGNYDEAEKAYLHAHDLQPEAMQVVALLGDLERVRGHLDQSRAYYLQVEAKQGGNFDVAYHLACVEAMAGNTQASLEWLDKAFQRGFNDYSKLYEDPQLLSVRDNSRFRELVSRYFPQ
ncbi:MAG: tetratricopeptide repeat protein [Desulfobacteraceae bacterium]|nr:tetratricopeptide repeat protein [Desulfobacteraceae bacterium]